VGWQFDWKFELKQYLYNAMKIRAIELDVDLIGVQGSALTEEEEKAISEYIHSQKAKRIRTSKSKKVKV
jgi:7-cyano-7-deazaguanine synthase in queuosine biosynthesis